MADPTRASAVAAQIEYDPGGQIMRASAVAAQVEYDPGGQKMRASAIGVQIEYRESAAGGGENAQLWMM